MIRKGANQAGGSALTGDWQPLQAAAKPEPQPAPEPEAAPAITSQEAPRRLVLHARMNALLAHRLLSTLHMRNSLRHALSCRSLAPFDLLPMSNGMLVYADVTCVFQTAAAAAFAADACSGHDQGNTSDPS